MGNNYALLIENERMSVFNEWMFEIMNEWTTDQKWKWLGRGRKRHEEKHQRRLFCAVLAFAWQTDKPTNWRTDLLWLCESDQLTDRPLVDLHERPTDEQTSYGCARPTNERTDLFWACKSDQLTDKPFMDVQDRPTDGESSGRCARTQIKMAHPDFSTPG